MNKAKIGDRIKSMNIVGLPDRGHYIGMVTWINVDDKDGVEYVYYTALVENRNGVDRNMWREMKVPQNGTESLFEGLTNNIEIL